MNWNAVGLGVGIGAAFAVWIVAVQYATQRFCEWMWPPPERPVYWVRVGPKRSDRYAADFKERK